MQLSILTLIGLSVMGIISLRRKPFFLFLSLVFVSAATVVLQLFVSKGYKETLNLSARVEIWEKAFDVISKNPINFIFGPGSGAHAYNTQFETKGSYYPRHNSYIFFWLAMGILGLISFLSLFIVAFARAVRNYRFVGESLSKATAFASIGMIPSFFVRCLFTTRWMGLADKALILALLGISEGPNHSFE